MKAHSSRAALRTGTRSHPTSDALDHPGLRAIALTAFVLLGAALCARSLLWELWSVYVSDLLERPETRWSASLMIRHTVHLLSAAGIALGILSMALARRPWRLTGLEIGALILAIAALVSVPVASGKRIAINTALDTALPLLAAAILYQLLADRPAWRRALMAGLVAVAAANCWKGTAQHLWIYKQDYQAFQQNKQQILARMGTGPNDAQATIIENRLKARVDDPQPMGFFHHANVLAGFLVLGLTCSLAALAGLRDLRANRTSDDSSAPPVRLPLKLALAAALILAALAVWHLLVMSWVASRGAMVGLLAAGLTVGAARWLHSRPRAFAALLAGAFVLLQATLIVLALRAPSLYHDLAARGGKAGTFAVRLNYWQAAIRMFADHLLTGVGPGQFGDRYQQIKPIYATEDVSHPHNWLLHAAAEWGTLGLIGTLVALAGAGWIILRSLAGPPLPAEPSARTSLLPAGLLVLVCWLLVMSDLPARRWSSLPLPVVVSVLAIVFVSIPSLSGRLGQTILLAGLVAFTVHTTVESISGVPGAMWPFWAAVALAMSWQTQPQPALLPQTTMQHRISRACLIASGIAAVAVLVLSVRPMRAVSLMHQAQKTFLAGSPEQAVKLFRQAADTDTRNPIPLQAAAMIRQRLAQHRPAEDVSYLREIVELNQQVVQRDPRSPILWQNLALARMTYGCRIDDYPTIYQAIADMRKSLELWPNRPMGWLELAQMAAVQPSSGPDKPALLQVSLDALDKVAALDDLWPADDLRKLTPAQREGLQRFRTQILERYTAATQPAR